MNRAGIDPRGPVPVSGARPVVRRWSTGGDTGLSGIVVAGPAISEARSHD